MKREILFKAKRIDNGEWVEGFYLKTGKYYPEEEHLIARDESKVNMFALDYFPVNPDTICQFTGLLDKNGKKIFEGDKLNRMNGKIDIVVFDTGQFVNVHEDGSSDYIAVKNNFEIIGNIHD